MSESIPEPIRDAKQCSRCDGPLEPGFVEELGGTHLPIPTYWAKGIRKKSFWQGLVMDIEERHMIEAFRCGWCHHLDLFAPERPDD